MQRFPEQDPGLEGKLRNLILTNTGNGGGLPDRPLQGASIPRASEAPGTPGTAGAPSAGVQAAVGEDDPPLELEDGDGQARSARHNRKRPNQAQRRQMSAQLSIPIDPRPSISHPGQHHITTSSPGYSTHQYSASHNNAQRPHSATFRPQYQQQHHSQHNQHYQHHQQHQQHQHQHHHHQYHQPPNASMTGGPFPQQTYPRHQQSLSYNGPMPGLGQGNWGHQSGPFGEIPARSYPHEMPSPFMFDGGPSPGLGPGPSPRTPRHPNASLYNPGRQNQNIVKPEDLQKQVALLDGLCETIIRDAEISYDEIVKNEQFRVRIEQVCRNAITEHERNQNGNVQFPPSSVLLKCFGSLASGFATKASDMDLGLLSPLSLQQPDDPGSPIPRLVEKAFLNAGLGARLLTRTRVPIIKLCEKPPEKLRQALLSERLRWERGEDEDHDAMDGAENPDEPEPSQSPVPQMSLPAESVEDHATEVSDNAAEKIPDVGSDAYENRLANLRQGQRTDLVAYYSAAKRLLRSLGGREIRPSATGDLDDKQLRIVTDISLAFVRGLSDDELRGRLEKTKSVSFEGVAPYPATRSLAGMYTQIEGERLVMAWEQHRSLDGRQRQQGNDSRIRDFDDLQNTTTFGLDLAGFDKDLKAAVDAMKRLPPIQFQTLSQGQYESSLDYYVRLTKLLFEYGVHRNHEDAMTDGAVMAAAANRYAVGIYNKDIRDRVLDFLRETGTGSLKAVARRHKSLQLALDFERALQRGFYEDHRAAVKRYVAILRGPMVRLTPPRRHFDFIVPVPPEDAPLLKVIRELPDPSRAAPNQPRDPFRDKLEFPKTGAGVQCDINFSAHLALQNTLLLRCYSHTDPRVRPLVLFVKHWAKTRGINSPYRGTLSSYGYVLMMLHYLVNVAQPFVCPNLQELAPPPNPHRAPGLIEATEVCKGRNIRFWRDEDEIKRLAAENALNQNRDSVGHLLRGFFEYYAQGGMMSTVACRGFDWGRDVLSLRTPGGLRTKQEKGWTGAKTVIERQSSAASDLQHQAPQHHIASPPLSAPLGPRAAVAVGEETKDAGANAIHSNSNININDSINPLTSPTKAPAAATTPRLAPEVKEVRHRYLFAIEDPFELDHNVARTVTHNGIVAIRDEFRRAWRIIKNAGKAGGDGSEELLQEAGSEGGSRDRDAMYDLLQEIHSREYQEFL